MLLYYTQSLALLTQCFYNIFGGLFFMSMCYFYFKFYFKMNNLELPPMDKPQTAPSIENIDMYKERLIKAHEITIEDANTMTVENIKKKYLEHEHKIVKATSKNVKDMLTKFYCKSVSQIVCIKDIDELENSLNQDVFVEAAVNQFIPDLYYRFGASIALITVPLTTAAHIDYSKSTEGLQKYFPFINGDIEHIDGKEESEENKQDGETTNN